MLRKPKPRPANTPERQKKKRDSYLLGAFRKIWRWEPARKECLKAEECAGCKTKTDDLKADHIDPVVNPKTGFVGWDDHYERLFNGRLQPLCKMCHDVKTNDELKVRQKSRAGRAEAEQ